MVRRASRTGLQRHYFARMCACVYVVFLLVCFQSLASWVPVLLLFVSGSGSCVFAEFQFDHFRFSVCAKVCVCFAWPAGLNRSIRASLKTRTGSLAERTFNRKTNINRLAFAPSSQNRARIASQLRRRLSVGGPTNNHSAPHSSVSTVSCTISTTSKCPKR